MASLDSAVEEQRMLCITLEEQEDISSLHGRYA